MSTGRNSTRGLLVTSNEQLAREIDGARRAIVAADISPLLEPHRREVLAFAVECDGQVRQNLADLALGLDNIFEEVRSNTTQVLENVRLLTRLLTGPILRSNKSDDLSLRIIHWIHKTDPLTANMPAACQDGDAAVLPLLLFAPLYYFPSLATRGLLSQPLYFHEFGHVLYALRRPEMDALVGDLQIYIGSMLEPLSRRNDELAKVQLRLQRTVVDTWYAWAQEFFCDAVGLTMAGPAFLYGFSDYCSRLAHGDFIMPAYDLEYSSHPVTGLRIRLLIERARRLRFAEAADRIAAQWASVSAVLGVREDYFGFFEDSWQARIVATLDDMLTEANPQSCSVDEAAGAPGVSAGLTPVALLNRAWERASDAPNTYAVWEAAAISEFLASG